MLLIRESSGDVETHQHFRSTNDLDSGVVPVQTHHERGTTIELTATAQQRRPAAHVRVLLAVKPHAAVVRVGVDAPLFDIVRVQAGEVLRQRRPQLLIALLIGQLVTQATQEESRMQINKGESVNYLERFHGVELALIDVTDPEPLPEDHPLWGLDNAQVTMHLSGRAQTKMFQRSADRFIENLERWHRGEAVQPQLDLDLGY